MEISFYVQPWQPLQDLENTRAIVEAEVTAYTLNHYKHGICSVFSVKNDEGKAIVACIEDHQFQPKNLWYLCIKMLLKQDLNSVFISGMDAGDRYGPSSWRATVKLKSKDY